MQKTNKNRTSESHHQILHIQNSLGIKFQLKLTILNLLTKLTQQEYIQSKKEKIENHHWVLHIWISSKFQFQQTTLTFEIIFPNKHASKQNRKNQHDYWMLHFPISFNIKFHFKWTILDFEITFAQNRYFQQKTKKCTTLFNTAYWN